MCCSRSSVSFRFPDTADDNPAVSSQHFGGCFVPRVLFLAFFLAKMPLQTTYPILQRRRSNSRKDNGERHENADVRQRLGRHAREPQRDPRGPQAAPSPSSCRAPTLGATRCLTPPGTSRIGEEQQDSRRSQRGEAPLDGQLLLQFLPQVLLSPKETLISSIARSLIVRTHRRLLPGKMAT